MGSGDHSAKTRIKDFLYIKSLKLPGQDLFVANRSICCQHEMCSMIALEYQQIQTLLEVVDKSVCPKVLVRSVFLLQI